MEKNSTRRKKPAGHGFIKELMSGSLVTDKIILKNLGFIVFLAFLAALYIANRFHAEDLVRRSSRLQNEVKELRAEALSISADLNYSSKQSEVISLVRERELGLEELVEPPYLVVVRK
ncbi:MAG: FtsL-like putative cell division protein [Bacteroidales bacterium]|jgi:predicted Zn-dependent peptidase|nr:FtsL-like putative cell division protein [Bacteroidales bacterium]